MSASDGGAARHEKSAAARSNLIMRGDPGYSDAPPQAGQPEPGRRRWAVLAVVSAAQFLIVFDLWVVNIALPALQRDFAPATLGASPPRSSSLRCSPRPTPRPGRTWRRNRRSWQQHASSAQHWEWPSSWRCSAPARRRTWPVRPCLDHCHDYCGCDCAGRARRRPAADPRPRHGRNSQRCLAGPVAPATNPRVHGSPPTLKACLAEVLFSDQANGHEAKKRMPAQSASNLKPPERLRLV
jgi:hypothetical protein